MDNSITIPISDVTKRLTVNVKLTGARIFYFRLLVGTKLIMLAARIMGVNAHVEIDDAR